MHVHKCPQPEHSVLDIHIAVVGCRFVVCSSMVGAWSSVSERSLFGSLSLSLLPAYESSTEPSVFPLPTPAHLLPLSPFRSPPLPASLCCPPRPTGESRLTVAPPPHRTSLPLLCTSRSPCKCETAGARVRGEERQEAHPRANNQRRAQGAVRTWAVAASRWSCHFTQRGRRCCLRLAGIIYTSLTRRSPFHLMWGQKCPPSAPPPLRRTSPASLLRPPSHPAFCRPPSLLCPSLVCDPFLVV